MKRLMAIVSIFAMLTMFAPMASAETIPWQYAENYTKVVVAGQTYENYLILIKDGDSFYLHNVATDLLQSLHPQGIVTPDRMFSGVKELAKVYVQQISELYPQKEVVAINYTPWQETEFKDSILSALPNEHAAFAGDASHNGYAYDVFVHNVPFEQAQSAYVPLVSLPVYTKLANIYTDSAAYEGDGNTSAYSGSAMHKVTVGTYGYHLSNKQIGTVTETGESYEQPTEASNGLNFTEVNLPLLEQLDTNEPVGKLGLAKDLLNLDGQDAIQPDDKVVILYRGWCPSSGYGIGIDDLLYNDGSIEVIYHINNPDPDQMYLTVMTYVYSVAVISDDVDLDTELIVAPVLPHHRPNPDQIIDGVDFYSLEQAPLLAQNAYEYPVAFYGLARDFLAVDTMNIDPDSYVVVLIRGWMSSTGYDINVQSVIVDDHTLTVSYQTKDPGPDEFCGTAMTYVYEVVELKNFAPQYGNYFIVTKPAEDKPPVTPGNDEPYVLPMPLVARLTVGDKRLQMTNGNLADEITLPIAPCKLNGTTVVPVRAFMNGFNALVDYQAATGQIIISRGTSKIELTVGSPVASVNGQQVQMGVKAQFIQGNLVAPLRTMAEALGAEVKYDQTSQQIVVYLHNWQDKA